MPELPEVEVVRRGLEQHVVGATITSVAVLHPRPVRRDPRGPEGFAAALTQPAPTGARAPLPLNLQLGGISGSSDLPLELAGPGDVVGLDPAEIGRTLVSARTAGLATPRPVPAGPGPRTEEDGS